MARSEGLERGGALESSEQRREMTRHIYLDHSDELRGKERGRESQGTPSWPSRGGVVAAWAGEVAGDMASS